MKIIGLSKTSLFMYLLSGASAVVLILRGLGLLDFPHFLKISLCFLFALFLYIGSFLRLRQASRKIRNLILFLFVFYIAVLIDFTLIDGGFGRNILNVFTWDEDSLNKFIAENVNLVPFETVKLFISGYKNGYLDFGAFIENIFGNLLAFMPMAFFTPCLWKKADKWYFVLAIVLCSILAVELLQFICLTGSSDIDDVILNAAGAMGFYGILKIKAVKKHVSAATFGLWGEEHE